MEILKRVINLIYALANIFWILLVGFLFYTTRNADSDYLNINIEATFFIFLLFSLIALVTAVINFALFKKFTVWNK